jgi:hypothetical protein
LDLRNRSTWAMIDAIAKARRKGCHQKCGSQCQDGAYDNPDEPHAQAVPGYHFQNVGRARTERHADADLVHSEPDGVRQYTIDAHGCEDQGTMAKPPNRSN